VTTPFIEMIMSASLIKIVRLCIHWDGYCICIWGGGL